MARSNIAKGGLRYWGSIFAENVTPRVLTCFVASNNSAGLFKGDPVKRTTDGSVLQAAAGDNIFGVVAGARYKNAAGVMVESDYLPASTTWTLDNQRSIVYVIPATPFTIFEGDADDGSSITTIAAARSVGWENVDHVFTTTGSTSTGLSGCQLDISTHNTTSSGWRILDIAPYPSGNDVTQTLAKYLVICNETNNWPGTFSTTGI